MDEDQNRPTHSTWCPHHLEPADHGCRGCAGDHAAGDHATTPVQYCRRCHPRPAKVRRPARSYHQTPDVAAIAANDDSLF